MTVNFHHKILIYYTIMSDILKYHTGDVNQESSKNIARKTSRPAPASICCKRHRARIFGSLRLFYFKIRLLL